MKFFFPCFIRSEPYLIIKIQFVAKVGYCTLGILGFTFGLKIRCKARTCKTYLSTDQRIRNVHFSGSFCLKCLSTHHKNQDICSCEI